MKQSIRVVVGISGGVDSAISAYLLQQQGYDVVGLFMRNWDSLANQEFNAEQNPVCPQEADYQDALAVCHKLGIKLYRKDFIQEYWDLVFKMFLAEFKQNRTPNPDVFCNKYIKFSAFYHYAKTELQAEKIAMGHYAQVKYDETTKQYQLWKGVDETKDQSYFLAQLSQQQLKNVIFPLGNLRKTDVRKLATLLQLPVAEKKDSTGICFVGSRDFKSFLANYLPAKPGDTIDIDSKQVIGRHHGVYYYTIGQRKGLDLSGFKKPYFVVDKDVINNILYVANDNETKWLMRDSCQVEQVNWINPPTPVQSVKCMAKFRYRQPDVPVTLTFITNESAKVKSDVKVRALTCGQVAVFYQGDHCLGSGVITEID